MLAFEAPVRTICVTGMHRSGTSLGARALEALGVWFGAPALLLEAGSDNQAGYWESRPLKELNEDLLAHLGGSWDSPPVLATGWEQDPSLDEFRAVARQQLAEVFGTAPTATAIGWKDPRLSLLLAFWHSVTPIEAVVVLVRDPAEVAGSLSARNGIGPTQAHLLWLRYLLAITLGQVDHVVIDYQGFFDDLDGTLLRMAERLSLPAPTDVTREVVRAHFDPSLRHHDRPDPTEPVTSDEPVVALAEQVWNGGDIDVAALPGAMARAIAEGWLRPPVDTSMYDEARAQVVDLTELLRRRTRKRADAARAPYTDTDVDVDLS
jgi:hypothetical protein